MNRRTSSMVTALAVLVAIGTQAYGLDLGDPAPPLAISEWVQGDAVDLKKEKGKRIVLVEFWATWCPPCKVSVPLLTKLQETHEKDLVIIGVTAPDFRGNSPEAVRKFVKGQGKAMTYHVAIDKAEATTNAYMLAAQVMGIPHAFLVDRDGKIAWIGSPLDPALEGVIERVIAGDYDVEAAKIEAELQRRLPNIIRALQMGQPDMAWNGLLDILKFDSANETALEFLTAVHAEHIRDTQAFRSWAQAYIAKQNKNATAMHRLTNAMCNVNDLTMRTPDLALEAGKYGYEGAKSEPAAIAAYARALFQIGDLEQAIALQTDAVATTNGKDSEIFVSTLAYYNLCKKLQASKN